MKKMSLDEQMECKKAFVERVGRCIGKLSFNQSHVYLEGVGTRGYPYCLNIGIGGNYVTIGAQSPCEALGYKGEGKPCETKAEFLAELERLIKAYDVKEIDHEQLKLW